MNFCESWFYTFASAFPQRHLQSDYLPRLWTLIVFFGMVFSNPICYGQGQVILKTFDSATATGDARAYMDYDMTTPCPGTNFVAQLYAGDGTNISVNALIPVGSPVSLLTDNMAGYISAGSVQVTAITGRYGTGGLNDASADNPAGIVTLQIRVWDANYSTYAEARADFAAAGRSASFRVIPTFLPSIPDAAGLSQLGKPNFRVLAIQPPPLPPGMQTSSSVQKNRTTLSTAQIDGGVNNALTDNLGSTPWQTTDSTNSPAPTWSPLGSSASNNAPKLTLGPAVAINATKQSAQRSLDITPNIAGVDLAGYSTPYPFLASVNSCHWGDTFTTYLSVANLGSANFSGSFNIGFYLSRDTTITNSDDYRVSRVTWNTSILANTAYGASLPISLPSICPFTGNPQPTNFYLAMWVDCDNTAGDVNPSNNKNQGANIDRTSSLITIL